MSIKLDHDSSSVLPVGYHNMNGFLEDSVLPIAHTILAFHQIQLKAAHNFGLLPISTQGCCSDFVSLITVVQFN